MRYPFTAALLFIKIASLHAQSRERVLAEVNYVQDGRGSLVMRDSSRFTYSGNRHSDLYPPYPFMPGYGYGYGLTSPVIDGLYPDYRALDPLKVYDSSLHEGVAFDTLKVYQRNEIGIVSLHSVEIRSYRDDGTTSRIERHIPSTSEAYGIQQDIRQDIYYRSGRIARVYHQERSAGRWDTTMIRTVLYNFVGQVVLDSVSHNLPPMPSAYIIYYRYNAKGQYSGQLGVAGPGSQRDTLERVTNEYDADGRLFTINRERWKAGPEMEPLVHDSFTYTPGVHFPTSQYQFYWGSREEIAAISYRVNAGSQPDSLTRFVLRAGGTRYLFSGRYDYNTAGNPVMMRFKDLDSVTGAGAGMFAFTRWYYREYKESGSSPAAAITIAPNPSTGTLMLHYPGYKRGEPISIAIYNMSGQLVHTESLVPQGEITLLMPADWAAGLYGIVVYGPANSALYRGTLRKE